ncbi:type 4a pilus biogenesis protein PilO [Protaetiibacter mangrovi]|uniref:Type 4a pilus biogenesis protein PilO n=1 Tax=Protaetiibacter mangrovi TaxID=2970926 RepID=A0ABT1ZD75_9MICO|nr:type 4a pilus biogenesis protein PilO [Protaetiibacter mangrovi]MCS0498631.1 type 4a pilus biogenesis protein PilO [Protaetiibacter mangrovi]TPX02490.1 hypothetical protein FJ656_22120 [Schumannella luteola]
MKLSTQVWGLITFVVVVGVLAAGWFLGVSPQLSAQALADGQRKAAIAQNTSIQTAIDDLKKEEANLPEYQARAAEIEKVIPSGLESAAFITTLNNLATATAVTIEQISIGEVVKYAPPTGDENPDGAPKPVTDSRISGDNFLLVPVTLSVSGGWNEVLAFTHGVQTGDRLMLVTKVTTSGDGTTFTTTLNGTMYVLLRQAPPASASADSTDAATDTAAAG